MIHDVWFYKTKTKLLQNKDNLLKFVAPAQILSNGVVMSDSAGASAPSAPSTNSAPSTQNSAPTLDEARVNLAVQAEKDEASERKASRELTERDTFAESEPEAPKREASKPKEPAAESDDDLIEAFGEKLTRKEYKELREAHKRRQEFDRAAHAKMQDAARQRKEVEAEKAEILRLANSLKENPWALMEKLGLNPEELAEQRLVASMKRAQMTPEQIEMAEMKAKLAKYEQTEQETQKTAKEARQAELKKQHIQRYDQQIGQAMEAVNLARTRSTAAKVARVMAEYKQDGVDIDPRVAAEIVRGDYHTEISHELVELVKTNPRAAIAMLPKELVAEIKKQAVQKAADFVPQAQPKRDSQIQPQQPKPKTPPTLEEARAKMGIRTY